MIFYRKMKEKEKYIRAVINPLLLFEIYFILQIAITIAVFLIAMQTNLYKAITMSVLAFILLYFIWEFLVSFSKGKLQDEFIYFTSTFASIYAVSNNTLRALKEVCDFIKEPIRHILIENIFLYEKGQLTFEELFKKISKDIGMPSYTNFFTLVYYADESGANIVDITTRLLESEYEKQKIRSQLKGTISVGIGVIFFTILITIYMVSNALTTKEIIEKLGFQAVLVTLVADTIALIIGKMLMNWLEE
ncbi:hypothetical protein ACAG39_01990 [Caldicellulosiruptoraceae bacterium PP1]